MTTVTKTLLLLLLAMVCGSLANSQHGYAQRPSKPGRAEAVRINAYVGRNYPVKTSNDPLVDQYTLALIKANQFEKAFQALTTFRRNFSGHDSTYCDEMRSAYRLTELVGQLDQLESRSARSSSLLEESKRYRAEATVWLAITQKDIPKATELYFQLSRQDAKYFVQATLKKIGEPLVEEFITSLVANTKQEHRAKTEAELWRYTKPKKPYHLREQERRLKSQENLAKLKKLELGPKIEWIEEVSFERNLPSEAKLPTLQKFLRVLKQEDLTPAQVSEYHFRMTGQLIEFKQWDVLLEVLKNDHPSYKSVSQYRYILSAVADNIPDQLEKFVKQTPDATGKSPYDERLIDWLLNAGFIAKAAKNTESLEEDFNRTRFRLKAAFYQALQAADFIDIDKIKLAYDKVAKGIEANESLFELEHVLGYEHLALLAKRGGPEVALQASRVVTDLETKLQDPEYAQPANTLGKCLAPLLVQNEFEIAFAVGKLATQAEREEARLGSPLHISRDFWRKMDPARFTALEEIVPNDTNVIDGATQAAINQQNEAQALNLARRQMLKNRTSWNGRIFAKASPEWAEKYLAVAKEVENLKAGDPLYRNHQEICASYMRKAMQFRNAEEAIAFVNKYMSQPKYKYVFLLELAQDWAE